MRLRHAGIALVTAVGLASIVGIAGHARSPEVTMHEWGTFTTVAGVDGRAINWLPLAGPSDLPCFVKHVNANFLAKVAPGAQAGAQLSFEAVRSSLLAKVRMETPVIYFYSPTEFNATVGVTFPRGIITEFYPTPTQPALAIYANVLNDPNFAHSLEWKVRVSPETSPLYPNGGTNSHYYAARETDATPLRAGPETEKFIFYRGIASFDVPIQTKLLANGDVEVWNLAVEGALPTVILFESRNGKIGFRAAGELSKSVTLAPPALTSDIASIRKKLTKELERAGLFPKEAEAMVNTWRDSWFEEGSRVFYILPTASMSAILPLSVIPSPNRVARVFVGRQELITNASMAAVKTALEQNDTATLDRYGRFLSPIADRIVATNSDPALRDRIEKASKTAFANYTRQLRACE
jgi:hypothetical protein